MPRVKEEVLIPKSRVAVLIGRSGSFRNKLAKFGRVSLQISQDGTINISGNPDRVWLVSSIIEAVGRGFSPQDASLLFNKEYSFELIYVNEFAAKSKKRQKELRGRLIGTQGKIKQSIQRKTKTKISVQGKTVAIIGPAEGVVLARKAVSMILRGAKYGSALGFLKQKEE